MNETDLSTIVIGIGNEYRRDDSAGLWVARQVKEMDLLDVRVLEASGEGTTLMEMWKGFGSVVLVDAVHSGSEPGTIHELDAHGRSIPTGFFHYSTHAFSVAEAIELARALDQLPPRLLIYGIEGEQFEAGAGLSPAVQAAVPEVARMVREIIEAKR
jgi:hydrogenase maturation protease